MSVQTANYPLAYKTPQFAFLARPPPPQKQRPSPNTPLPALPGTPPPAPSHQPTTFSSIASWAAHVQPGSPAPRSPHRRPSLTSIRRPSISRLNRRPSITHGRAPSGSFIHLVDTPTRTRSTPSVANFDLTALGYTSIFVHIPKTPTTPSPLLRQYQHNRSGVPVSPSAALPLSASAAFAHIPIPPVPRDSPNFTTMKRFRSLSILRSRASKAKNAQSPASPPTKTAVKVTPTHSDSATSKESKAEIHAATIAKRKRAKYAYVRPPPTLANELAMMQFADGGSLESHAKRVMEAQAKAAAGSGPSVGVADVYRDGKGGIWWDREEETEYAHLLDGTADTETMDVDVDEDVEMHWEAFGAVAFEPLAPFLAQQQPQSSCDKENLPEVLETRRSSLSSVDSDLDPKYLVPLPENEDPRHAPVEDRILASRRIGGPGMSVLSLPARPRRRAMHLSKPGFLIDLKAFQAPRSPVRSSSSSVAPSSPGLTPQQGGSKPKARGKARRRPAPLQLANSNTASAVVVICRPATTHAAPAPSSTGAEAERLRREFIEESFEPCVLAPAPTPSPLPRPSLGVLPTPSSLAAPSASASASMLSLLDSRAATPNSMLPVKRTKSRLGVRGFFNIARRGD